MWPIPLKYEEPVYRPPAEAESLLIPVTVGCSHNRCTFCAMYRSKKYRVRPNSEIEQDLKLSAAHLRKYGEECRKIFFCDGDALSAPFETLHSAAHQAGQLFPKLRRIAIYASAGNILEKTPEELQALAALKLRLAYAGLESGSEQVLKLIGKGFCGKDMVDAADRLRLSGWQLSQIVMLGLGGKALSDEHCTASAKVVSDCAPEFFSFLTTVPVPGTPYHAQVESGKIQPLSSRELLQQMHAIISELKPAHGKKIIFRANHVSNQFPLEGTLPRDRERLLEILKGWISACPAEHYPKLNPAYL